MNWFEFAQKMAESARARLALNRKRLKEILAERKQQQSPQQTSPNAR
jgi:exonuclease VII small subunit